MPFKLFSFKKTYPGLAVAVWAIVMWLFEYHDGSLHGSLAESMRFLYHESNVLTPSIGDFSLSLPALVVLLGAAAERKGTWMAPLFGAKRRL